MHTKKSRRSSHWSKNTSFGRNLFLNSAVHGNHETTSCSSFSPIIRLTAFADAIETTNSLMQFKTNQCWSRTSRLLTHWPSEPLDLKQCAEGEEEKRKPVSCPRSRGRPPLMTNPGQACSSCSSAARVRLPLPRLPCWMLQWGEGPAEAENHHGMRNR